MHDLSIQRPHVYDLTYLGVILINKGWGRIPFLNTFHVKRHTEKIHGKQNTQTLSSECTNWEIVVWKMPWRA